MFEAYTYEALLEDVLNEAPEEIDTRPGSIFYDAIAGILLKVAKLYTDLELVFQMSQLDTAGGEYLDTKASEYGIERRPATRAEYDFSFEGVEPKAGERFFAEGIYFTLCKSDTGALFLRADDAGSAGNYIVSQTSAVPLNNLTELKAAAFGTIRKYGTDIEDDETLRERIRAKLAGASENGNKAHYKAWCESVDGVGLARITPLWNGPNTVKATLITPAGTPCSEAVVEAVQQYVDPAENGYTSVVEGVTYTVGDGLGEGVANLGAHFTAVAAAEKAVSLSCGIELSPGSTAEQAEAEITTAAAEYMRLIALDTDGEAVVRISNLGAIITGLSSVLDYRDLMLNGATENIVIAADSVPKLAEVSVDVL